MENIKENDALREITENEVMKWKQRRDSKAIPIIEEFLDSKMKMAEVNLNKLPKPKQKKDARKKSTKQDSFASSFYAWKSKKSTQEKLKQLRIDITLVRRGGKAALKKKKL